MLGLGAGRWELFILGTKRCMRDPNENVQDETMTDLHNSWSPLEKWLMYTTEIRENFGVSSCYNPWTTEMGAQMVGVPRNTPRATELIECVWIKRIKDAAKKKKGETDPAKLAKGLYVVLSQSTHRNTGSHNIHALLQNSVLYSHPSVA